MTARFDSQLQFLIEIDKMKSVLRQTILVDRSRRENDAEHSWHFALTAMIFQEYAAKDGIDLFRVLKMALIHDLVEIYAGDTFAYDEQANNGKAEREQKAAERIFGLLPRDQATELYALWEEFEAMQTPDACYAAAIDRLQPFVNNYMTEGHTWKQGRVTKEQVYKRMAVVEETAPELWRFIQFVVDDSIKKGYIIQ